MAEIKTITHYINGKKFEGKGNEYGDVYSPSTGEIIGKVPFATSEEVDEAVALAKEAQIKWAGLSIGKRAEVIIKFRQLLTENEDELAEIIGRENGKTIADAKGEIGRGLESVDLATGVGQILKGEISENVGGNINMYSLRQPLGVVTTISPFNFPVMVPLAMSVMAIAVGNALILKPSEKVPQSAIYLAELWTQAGLPAGIFNVINGAVNTVTALITHDDIKAISFVGSTNTARIIYETGTKHNKRVNAFGGGKNQMVIMPDADIDQAVNSFLSSGFGAASQRCMALSIAMPVGEKTAKEFTEKLTAKVKDLKVGAYDDLSADFGALIDQRAKDSVLAAIEKAKEEGANILVDGSDHSVAKEKGFYLGPTLVDGVTPEMDIYKEEVFGPIRPIMTVASLEEAIALINDHKYGNGITIFTNSGRDARKFTTEVQVGMVGVNVPIPIPVGYHNFGGWKQSRFGDGQMFGPDTARFFTNSKTVSERWFDLEDDNEANFAFPSN